MKNCSRENVFPREERERNKKRERERERERIKYFMLSEELLTKLILF